ncbi:hypothetical protein [Actinocrispum wychmicini]|uniref:Uncharacterized protein n=1 Tax=Actinocrispum wychmicini TaxID=1213861 RepID=A0A4R2JYI7_9PSEU|nr:hypothetical protein [Actinocrispum wychmicini]TCO64944.1 hypothetical protein EV192_101728 [Actinocrispum wychmicini]
MDRLPSAGQRAQRLALACARPAGLLLRAAPALIGLLLVSYGAGLVYVPAGFITAGTLVLVDVIAGRVADERRTRAGDRE